jgi:hypothetical protein
MSSHHFVKEGQEPALLIANPSSLALVQPLLEWAPYVMVLNSSLERALLWGIKIDAVLIKDDEVSSAEALLIDHGPVTIVRFGKNDDAIACGLNFLKQHHQHSVNLISDSDAAFTHVGEFEKGFNISILAGAMKWSYLRDGLFEKWFPEQTKIFVKTSDTQSPTCHGLTETGPFEYEVTRDGLIKIQANAPLWIGESLL